MSRAKVISFINYKGGVGKTTTTYHIGCCLAQHYNKKVLFIDIDPQTNLTFLCSTIEKWEKHKDKFGTIATLYQRFNKKISLDTKKYIWRTPIELPGGGRLPNLDLLPCDIDLLGEDLGGGQVSGTYTSIDALGEHAKAFLRERKFLHNIVKEVEDNYDYILIDCPPNIYLMTQNALVASNWYIITAIPDHLSTIGLSILQKKVKGIGEYIRLADKFMGKESINMRLSQLGGVIFVKVRIGGGLITNTHSDRMQRVGKDLGADLCFKTYTTEMIGYSEAAENSLPIWLQSSPNAKRVAKKQEYNKITEEFLRRFERK